MIGPLRFLVIPERAPDDLHPEFNESPTFIHIPRMLNMFKTDMDVANNIAAGQKHLDTIQGLAERA